MGKFRKKITKVKRHEALDEQILGNRYAKESTRVKIRNRREGDDEFVDCKLTEKILSQARKQQEDLEEEVGLSLATCTPNFPTLLNDCDLSENKKEEKLENGSFENEKEMSEIEIDPEDEKAFDAFMPNDPSKRAALVDIVKDKMTEKETELSTIFPEASHVTQLKNEKMANHFKGLSALLCRYKSGKIPSAVKCLANSDQWEQYLNLTQPDKWTAAAVFQLTRIFASNLSAKKAQRFYYLYLLPRLRDDIASCKKLNVHLYQAVMKSIYKPSAFFKGMIIPLCESGSCTLREATIFGSIIAKAHLPILDSGCALCQICKLNYSGANSIFIRVLLEKKYALCPLIINTVVDHFMKFENDNRLLPLLWHQCLLTFVQNYKQMLNSDQQTDLLRLLKTHSHEHVTPEIRKELILRSISESNENNN